MLVDIVVERRIANYVRSLSKVNSMIDEMFSMMFAKQMDREYSMMNHLMDENYLNYLVVMFYKKSKSIELNCVRWLTAFVSMIFAVDLSVIDVDFEKYL